MVAPRSRNLAASRAALRTTSAAVRGAPGRATIPCCKSITTNAVVFESMEGDGVLMCESSPATANSVCAARLRGSAQVRHSWDVSHLKGNRYRYEDCRDPVCPDYCGRVQHDAIGQPKQSASQIKKQHGIRKVFSTLPLD